MKINKEQNALDLTQSRELWIEDHSDVHDDDVVEGARVGIGELHDAVHWPLRFGIKNHPCLSPKKFTS